MPAGLPSGYVNSVQLWNGQSEAFGGEMGFSGTVQRLSPNKRASLGGSVLGPSSAGSGEAQRSHDGMNQWEEPSPYSSSPSTPWQSGVVVSSPGTCQPAKLTPWPVITAELFTLGPTASYGAATCLGPASVSSLSC